VPCVIVGEERPKTDATSAQYAVSRNGTTNENTAENVKAEAPTEKAGTNKPDKDTNTATWVEVVKQCAKETNKECKQIVLSALSQNNPVK
jgi:hypothetical protein